MGNIFKQLQTAWARVSIIPFSGKSPEFKHNFNILKYFIFHLNKQIQIPFDSSRRAESRTEGHFKKV
tara:strand:+ start:151 stop:351 length:201 start_codon:yes stop_codon:yes gene_type:complete